MAFLFYFVYLVGNKNLEFNSNLSNMKNLLHTGEQDQLHTDIEYKAEQHWIIYVVPIVYVVVGVVGILPAIFGVGILRLVGFALLFLLFKGCKRILEIQKTKIFLSSTHLCIQQGILSNTLNDIALEKLEGIQLNQSLMGKYLNFGTLYVSTGEISQQYKIKNPLALRSKILKK